MRGRHKLQVWKRLERKVGSFASVGGRAAEDEGDIAFVAEGDVGLCENLAEDGRCVAVPGFPKFFAIVAVERNREAELARFGDGADGCFSDVGAKRCCDAGYV